MPIFSSPVSIHLLGYSAGLVPVLDINSLLGMPLYYAYCCASLWTFFLSSQMLKEGCYTCKLLLACPVGSMGLSLIARFLSSFLT